MSRVRRLLPRGQVGQWVLALLIGAAFMWVPYTWMEHHRIVPGLRGCTTIRDFDSRIDCIADQEQDAFATGDVTSRLAELDRESDEHGFGQDCHQAMHRVAEPLVREEGLSDRLVGALQTSGLCSSGFVHGLIQGLITSGASGVATVADSYCGAADTYMTAAMCAHGIGHGLEPRGIEAATRECAGLNHDDWVHQCRQGLFMERAFRAQGTSNPFALCSKVESASAYDCNVYTPGLVAFKRETTLDELLTLCQTETGGEALLGCIDGATLLASDADDAAICARLEQDRARQVCAANVISGLPDDQADPADWPDECTETLAFGCGVGAGEVARSRSSPATPPEVIADMCEQLPDAQRAGCELGAGACWPLLTGDRPGDYCIGSRALSGVDTPPADEAGHARSDGKQGKEGDTGVDLAAHSIHGPSRD